MDINWFEALLYGIVSGLTEFLPVSAQAHQAILLNLFGETSSHPLIDLFVRLGALTALVMTSGTLMSRMRHEYALSRSVSRRRKRALNMQAVLDIRFTRLASVMLLVGLFAYLKTRQWNSLLPVNALFLLCNGVILHIPAYLPAGNKDSRNMSALDSVLFGLGGALSALPGISRIGAAASIAAARGADTHHVFKWNLLLSVPALAGLLCLDIYGIFTASLTGVDVIFMIQSVLAGAAAFVGGSIAIHSLRNLTARSGLTGFSYYCWGAALFSFILYLY